MFVSGIQVSNNSGDNIVLNMNLKTSSLFTDFNDTFTESNGTADNWDVIAGNWTILNNEYLQNNTTDFYPISVISDANAFDWTDYIIESRVKINTTAGMAGLIGRYQDSNNYYAFFLDPDFDTVYLMKGLWGSVQTNSCVLSLNNWYSLKMDISGNQINCYVNDTLLISYIDGSSLESGKPGLWIGGDITTFFDNFYVNVSNFYDLKIRHFGTENSPALIKNLGTDVIEHSFILSPDSFEVYNLKEGDYQFSWVNGENNVNTTMNITLTSDHVLDLDSIYYQVYLHLFDLKGRNLDEQYFKLELDEELNDFGFNTFNSSDVEIEVKDIFGTKLYDSTKTLQGLIEFNIIVDVCRVVLLNSGTDSVKVHLMRGQLTVVHALSPGESVTAYLRKDTNYTFKYLSLEDVVLGSKSVTLTEDDDDYFLDYGFWIVPTIIEQILSPIQSNMIIFLILISVILVIVLFIVLSKRSKERKRYMMELEAKRRKKVIT
jgi:hypothetical protein